MRFARRKIRTTQRAQCDTAFVASYETGLDFAFPRDFDLAQYNLLLCESIRREKLTVIFLYWMSEERAIAKSPLVEKVLGIASSQSVGSIVEVRIPKPPRWIENPVKWGKWVVSAAALFGAMSVIRDNFTWIFAAPHVVVFAANSASPDYNLGDSFDIPLVVRNEASVGSADVRLRKIELRPVAGTGSPQPVHFDVSEVPQLQAGQNVELHLSGSARPSQNHQAGPKKYALEITAQAEEGWVWRWRPVTYRPYIVSFWPDRTWNSRLVQTSSQTAQVQITLRSGKSYPHGIHGQLTFNSTVPPESDGIALMDEAPFSGAKNIGAPILVRSSGRSIGKVEFQTDPLQAFHGYSFAISIALQRPMSDADWNALRSSTTVEFE